MTNLTMAAVGIAAFMVFVYAQGQLAIPSAQGNYIEVVPEMHGNDLILIGGCRAVNMTVSEHQAISIEYGIEKKFYVRPMTHDMMKDIFDNYGIKLVSARIDSFSGGLYTARVVLSMDNDVLDIDARPTDAVGLAVRMGVPVLFNRELLETNGGRIC